MQPKRQSGSLKSMQLRNFVEKQNACDETLLHPATRNKKQASYISFKGID
jgi:phosphoribosylaminoimidazole-succinocarboxamide synthase